MKPDDQLLRKCSAYMRKFCLEISGRSVGSEGNRMATEFFNRTISASGWDTELQEFDAIDWVDGGASLSSGNSSFEVSVSPYSTGCSIEARLACISSIEELERIDICGKILLLHGNISAEQLMPKNFIFYNPLEHQQIISLLEKGMPGAIVCATGRNATLAGGVYPFPLIEDGDFEIPSVFMTEDEGSRLQPFEGKMVILNSDSRRIPGTGCNVIARKGNHSGNRIVVTAHIDAKKGTPGAIDNATGVVVLLLLADLLRDYIGENLIEIVAFNGEDYYAVPGQMLWLKENGDRFDDILLNINIDGAGYIEGRSAFSFYGLPESIEQRAREVLNIFDGIIEGVQWAQGDHSIFVQHGRPAIAVSSEWFTENIDSQDITHTPKDNTGIVDCRKVVEIARALDHFVRDGT